MFTLMLCDHRYSVRRPKLFKFGSEIYFRAGCHRGRSAPPRYQETTMNKTLLALATATSITVSLLAAPPAEARCWGCAVGVGVAAGVVTGAIVGSAIANSRLTPCSPATRPTRAMRLRGRSNALGVTGRVARWHLTFMEIPSGGADPVSSVRKNSFAGGERRAGALKRSAPC